MSFQFDVNRPMSEQWREAEARLDELRPYAEEYERILSYLNRAKSTVNGGTQRIPLDIRKRQVCEILDQRPDARVKDVAEKLGVSVPRAVQVINAAEDDGLLVREQGGLKRTKSAKGSRR